MADWAAFERALAARRRAMVEEFTAFLRLDTVSQAPASVRAGAEWLAGVMRARGLRAEVLETGGNPAVVGERRVSGARLTLLLYSHYDVKPAPVADWLQPSPFEPVLREGLAEEGAPPVALPSVGDDALDSLRLYARGASDDKGPIWSHLEALRLMARLGMFPTVNLVLVLDGEEEIGSPYFGDFVSRYRARLAADVAVVTDGPKHESGRPTIAGGARGILALELSLEGARRDVHSGNFIVPNPAWKLAGLLASMATPDGVPMVEGLEEDVIMPTEAERRLMARIPVDRPGLERSLGVGVPEDYLERLMFRATLNIRGLRSGLTGPEASTIIPGRASVALDVRLVKNQRREQVYRRIIDHIRGQGFVVIESPDAEVPDALRGRAIRVVEKRGYDPAKTPLDAPLAQRVIDAVSRAHGGQDAVLLPTLGGSVPLWAFTDILGLPTLVVPYANANNRQHAPNEHLRLDHLFQGVRTTARLLTELEMA